MEAGIVISAVVWDMGGVFRRYFTEPMVDIGRARGWPLERLPLGPTGPVDDPDYRAMTEGLIEESLYLERLRQRLSDAGIAFDPMTDIDWDGEERPVVWEAIRVIAASPLFQAVLTNDASKWMGEDWWHTWEPARYFDVVIDVASLPFRKPRPEPYLEVIERTGFAPDECVFIDDMPVNCRGAEATGMHSVWFDVLDPDQSVASLLKMIGYEPGKELL